MSPPTRWRPAFTADFAACARACRLDILASALLFVGTSLAVGRVWRFPFDDEIYTLQQIERLSGPDLLTYYLTAHDVHPPLGYVLFWGLQTMGLGEAGMRLVSLGMTALALAIVHLVALALVVRRNGEAVAPATRLVAVLLFGLCALAASQGDALRWYPLFAFEVAVFLALYLCGANGAARLWSGVALGLAASTNFLVTLVIGPLVLYRYGLQRRVEVRGDIAFWLLVLLFGGMALCTAYFLVVRHFGLVGYQVGNGIVRAALTDVLGFFGGHSLGIGQIWLVAPAALIAAAAAIAQIDRKQPAQPVHLLLLILVAVVAMPLIGFAKPRSFLYLAPVMAAVLTLYLDGLMGRRIGLAMLLSALLITTQVAAIANIQNGARPFKRNTAIPYGAALDFIRANARGRALVVSTDPVIPWVLRHGREANDICAHYFIDRASCAAANAYDSVFVISGYSDKSDRPGAMRMFEGAVAAATEGRRTVATLPVGIDKDANLKTRLTGVALGEAILTIELYH